MNDVVTFGETMAALRGDGPLRLGATMQLSVAGAEANVGLGTASRGSGASERTSSALSSCARCAPKASTRGMRAPIRIGPRGWCSSNAASGTSCG